MGDEREDITAWIKDAASSLPLGQLIKKPDLVLVDAMNAIEMFHPKMDTGMVAESSKSAQNHSNSNLGGLDEPILFDPTRQYRPEEILWIMDEMLAAEIAWYRGVNLAQSVFRSLYYFHPDKVVSTTREGDGPIFLDIFRTWLVAYCKCIDLAYREFGKGHVNDMEDVWMDHFGIAVHLDDHVDDIGQQLHMAIGWLHDWMSQDPDSNEDEHSRLWKTGIFQAFYRRLENRQIWLSRLNGDPSGYRSDNDDFQDESVKSIRPEALVFEDVTPFLRQHMPPFTVTIPSHGEAFAEMRRMMKAVDDMSITGNDLLSWQIATRGRAWLKRDVSIVRSLYKSYFYERITNIAGRYISLLTGFPVDVLSMLEVRETEKQHFAIWRDIVGGLCITTLSTPTLNKARQRRSYLSLSFSWRERAALAEKLGLAQVAPAAHAIRLDCLLEGALAAFDNDLIAIYEERQAWWWIGRIAQHRVELGMVDWGHTWAEMWSAIAEMMFILLGLNPPKGPDSREQFELRHKWAIKIPTMWDGQKLESGLTPRYEDWCRDRDETLQDTDLIRKHGELALEAMLRLHRADLGRDSKDFRLILSDLREDICHNMTVDASGKWGERRRWIPILV